MAPGPRDLAVGKARSETAGLRSYRGSDPGDDPPLPGARMCDKNDLRASLGPYRLSRGDDGVREFAGLALTALEHSPGGVMAFEPVRDADRVIQDFLFTYVNRQGCETVGLPLSGLVGRTLLEVMPGNLEEGLFHKYVAVVETGEPLDHEHYYDHDGVERTWFHTIAVRGGPGLVVTFYDITSRKQAEREERRLRHLTEHIPGAVYQLHLAPDGRLSFPYVSAGFEGIFGLPASAVQHDAEPAFATVHPDDLDPVRRSVETSARTLEDWEEEFRRFTPDGSIRWIRGHSTPRRAPDGSVTWHGFVSDVTERRKAEALLAESEERFRGLFELSPLGIALNDLETGRFLETNPAFQQATGFDSDELRALSHRDLTPAEYLEGDREQEEVVRRRGEYGPYEKAYVRKDGSTSVALFSGRLVTGSDGRRLLWSIIQDISERKQEEQSRLDLQRRLMDNQRVESLGVMAGGMAHEFNNLLTVILGNLELMGLDRQDPETRALIDEAVLSGRRAAGLVSQLLTLSGRGRTPVATVRLNEVVDDWFRNRDLPGGGEGVVLRLAEEVPEVQGDPTAVRWILDALVSNSVEALDGRRGVIEVRTGGGTLGELRPDAQVERRGYLDPGEYAWMEVRDDGPGMDAQTRRRLFDPFFTTRFPGRGLGLPGVLGVVRLVNGGVELESAPGRGTRVRVYIPARRAAGPRP